MPKPVLLTVDDDPDVLRSVERDLRRKYGARYRILAAESGAAALDLLKRLEQRNEPVALFLVDHRMPQMTGIEFLGRARERSRRLPSACCSPPTPIPTPPSAPSTRSSCITIC